MSETNPDSYATQTIPEAPRPITPTARRRAFMEPVTRSWSILAILIVVTLIGVTVQGFLDWRRNYRMINNGPEVQAVAFRDRSRVKGRPLPIGQTVYIEYEYNGQKYQSQGPLFRTDEQYIEGEPFTIRIDPENPSVWSNRKVPTTMRESMVGSIITAIFAVVAVATALMMWWKNLRLWQHGEVRVGRVMEYRTSALAPRSVGLYCAVRSGRQDNLLTVYVPQSLPVPEVGQNVQLITNEAGTAGIFPANYQA